MKELRPAAPSPLLDPTFWGRPAAEGYRLSRLTVVGPYPTAGFFELLAEAGMDPRSLRLVVNNACCSSPDELRRALRRQRAALLDR